MQLVWLDLLHATCRMARTGCQLPVHATDKSSHVLQVCNACAAVAMLGSCCTCGHGSHNHLLQAACCLLAAWTGSKLQHLLLF